MSGGTRFAQSAKDDSSVRGETRYNSFLGCNTAAVHGAYPDCANREPNAQPPTSSSILTGGVDTVHTPTVRPCPCHRCASSCCWQRCCAPHQGAHKGNGVAPAPSPSSWPSLAPPARVYTARPTARWSGMCSLAKRLPLVCTRWNSTSRMLRRRWVGSRSSCAW